MISDEHHVHLLAGLVNLELEQGVRRDGEEADGAIGPGVQTLLVELMDSLQDALLHVRGGVGGVESVDGAARSRSIDRAAAGKRDVVADEPKRRRRGGIRRDDAHRRGHPERVGCVLGLALLVFAHGGRSDEEVLAARLEVPIR